VHTRKGASGCIGAGQLYTAQVHFLLCNVASCRDNASRCLCIAPRTCAHAQAGRKDDARRRTSQSTTRTAAAAQGWRQRHKGEMSRWRAKGSGGHVGGVVGARGTHADRHGEGYGCTERASWVLHRRGRAGQGRAGQGRAEGRTGQGRAACVRATAQSVPEVVGCLLDAAEDAARCPLPAARCPQSVPGRPSVPVAPHTALKTLRAARRCSSLLPSCSPPRAPSRRCCRSVPVSRRVRRRLLAARRRPLSMPAQAVGARFADPFAAPAHDPQHRTQRRPPKLPLLQRCQPAGP
jgi:hypothetical protein